MPMPTANLGQQIRQAVQTRVAEVRADAQMQGEAARAIGQQVSEAARAQADLLQTRGLLFRLTGEDDFLRADQFAYTQFTALNGSGITGGAILAFDDDTDTLTVAIAASGLEANQPHIQHIHGFPDGTDARTPTLAQDTDGDGYIELLEGVATYGPVLLDLATNHDNASGGDNGHAHEGGATGFPTAPDGKIWFVESYQLPEGKLGADPMLALREIIIHGMSVPATAGVGTTGEVNGTPGYKLVLPVASGEISNVASAQDLRAFIHDLDFDDAARANMHQMHGGWMVG
jgi:hypothetical protein